MRCETLGLVLLATLALGACTRRGSRDLPLQHRAGGADDAAELDGPAATVTLRSVDTPVPAGAPPRLVARVNARAVATSKTHIFFGDTDDDAVLAVAKGSLGGAPVRVARRAPIAGALAVAVADGELVWIGNPGDVVLRAAPSGDAAPTTIRDRGIFTDVAALGGDVFVVEQLGSGGALTRITGATTARLATIDAVPRAVLVDAEHAYVVTPTKVLRAPRQRGAVATLAEGTAFGAAAIDAGSIYVIAKRGGSRKIIRVNKAGGNPVEIVDGGVRDAPIATFGGEVFFFDESRPALRARSVEQGTLRTVSENAVFASPLAIAADADGVYVATGNGATPAAVVSVSVSKPR